jgi:glycosyltransferase involved in cell wall biosynthesis
MIGDGGVGNVGSANGAASCRRVSVVIPAMNEADNLEFILPLLPSVVDEVVLVDGRSTDATVEVTRLLRAEVIIVPQNGKGKGDALIAGFKAASGEIIVAMDADGSADPAEIPSFLAALDQGADFAKGTRFASGGGSADITRLRRIGNAVLTWLVNRLFGTRYTDLCYGFNAFRAGCLPYLSIDCDGFEVETLINIRVAKAGLQVTEVASFEHARLFGVSNLHAARDGRRVLMTILREWLSRSSTAARTPVKSRETESMTSGGDAVVDLLGRVATPVEAPSAPQS